MNVEKIYDILLNFSSNEHRGILIDGPWGVGKTYQINKFIEIISLDNKKEENKSKKTKIIYSSLFGVDSILDLHTELFAKLNPSKKAVKNVISAISPAFKLIPYAGETVSSSITYAIGNADESMQNLKNKLKQDNTKKRVIIILDDIERVGPNFNYKSLLGYMNQIYLSGIKIVCVCDTTKIKDEIKKDFEELKEKVFDRYYKVSKANTDIIKSYFKEDGIYLYNETIELFKENLRTTSKTSSFYFEVKRYLQSLDAKKYYSIKINVLLWYVSLVVTSLNQDVQITDYKRQRNDFDITYDFFNSNFKDENLSDKLNKCYQFDCDSKHVGKIIDEGRIDKKWLLLSLTYAYLFDDFSSLESILKSHDEINESYVSLICLSTKDRTEEIKRIINNIDDIDVMTQRQFQRILDIFEWDEIKSIKFDIETFINKLAEKCLNAKKEVTDTFYFLNAYEGETKKVLESVKVVYNILLIRKLLDRLRETFSIGNYDQICNLLNEIKQKSYCHIQNNNEKDLIYELKCCFIENKYFLPTLSGTIKEEDWHIVHAICDFINSFSLREEFSHYLSDLNKSTNDVDEKYRVTVLLKKYYPNLLKE